MRCPEMEEMLSAYANDELSAESMEAVERHLDGCAGCRESLEGFQEVRQHMESLRTLPATPDIRAAVMTRIKSTSQRGNPWKGWKKRVLVLAPIAVILAAVLIIQPWSVWNSPGEVMARAYSALAGLKSYRISITDRSGSTESNLEAAFVSPDRYHVTKTVNGKSQEIILAGDEQYYKGEYTSMLDMLFVIQGYSSVITREYTMELLNGLTDIRQLPDESIEGTDCLHYEGRADIEKRIKAMEERRMMMGHPPFSEEDKQDLREQMHIQGDSTRYEIWIGKSDYLIRLIKMERGMQEPEGILSTYSAVHKFYDFNEPISIEAPRDAAGNLLPGWASTRPDQPVLGKEIQSSIDNNVPTSRIINYTIDIRNISTEKLRDVRVRIAPVSAFEGVWIMGSLSSFGDLKPGEMVQYEVAFGYDATVIKAENIAEMIQSADVYISYLTPDGQPKAEMVELEVPATLYTLPEAKPVPDLSPAGEYRIEEPGAAYVMKSIYVEIDGKRYLFVQVETRNSGTEEEPGILVLDVQDPLKPVKAAYIQAPEGTEYRLNMAFAGTTLFVSTDSYLWILDVSNPGKPEEIARFSEVKVYDMAASGNYLYVNEKNDRLTALDISDPAHPQTMGSLELALQAGVSPEIAGGYLLVWGRDILYTVDISSPAAMELVNSYDMAPAHVGDRARAGNYIYMQVATEKKGTATGTEDEISAIDITDPANPYEAGRLVLKNRRIWGGLLASEGRVYITTQSDFAPDRKIKLETIDFTDPAHSKEMISGYLPDYWTFFESPGNRHISSYNLIDNYLYWLIGNAPNAPVIEIFELDQ
jgi:hypothetical protein